MEELINGMPKAFTLPNYLSIHPPHGTVDHYNQIIITYQLHSSCQCQSRQSSLTLESPLNFVLRQSFKGDSGLADQPMQTSLLPCSKHPVPVSFVKITFLQRFCRSALSVCPLRPRNEKQQHSALFVSHSKSVRGLWKLKDKNCESPRKYFKEHRIKKRYGFQLPR